MSKVVKSDTIHASPEKVIEYIADVNNHPAFISALKSISNIQGDPKSMGTVWDWTFVMAGIEMKGQSKTTAYQPGKEFAFETLGEIKSTFTYTAEPEGDGTKFSATVEYELPESILAKMVDTSVVENLNDKEGTQAIENLKAILES